MVTIQQLQTAVGEFQRNFLYKIVVEDMPLSLRASFPEAQATADMIDLVSSKAFFPDRKTEKITVKWAGEFIYFTGIESNTKAAPLTFRCDEHMWIKDLMDAAKDLTGTMENHAAVAKGGNTLQFGIYLVDMTKSIVTDYRCLHNVMVFSVSDMTLDKEAGDILTFTSELAWDYQTKDNTKRGKEI